MQRMFRFQFGIVEVFDLDDLPSGKYKALGWLNGAEKDAIADQAATSNDWMEAVNSCAWKLKTESELMEIVHANGTT